MKAAEMRPHIIETARGFVLAADAEKRNCIPQTPTDGFAEQNGRDAERAD